MILKKQPRGVYQDIKFSLNSNVMRGGKGEVFWGSLDVAAKKSSLDPKNCYELFNETVASSLARVCGLSVVDQIFCSYGNELYAVSPRIQDNDDLRKPPIVSFQLLKKLQMDKQFSHGMVLFDLWVGNNDRRFDNILWGHKAETPYLIDFGNSLLYRSVKRGILRLKEITDEPAALYREPNKTYDYTELLVDETITRKWTQKIASIPNWIIRDSIMRGHDLLKTAHPSNESEIGKIEACVYRFLLRRKQSLFSIVTKLALDGIFTAYKHKSANGGGCQQ